MIPPEAGRDRSEKALTSIPDLYTLSNTLPCTEDGEVDGLIVKQFLETLAEVAIAVANRSKSGEETER